MELRATVYQALANGDIRRYVYQFPVSSAEAFVERARRELDVREGVSLAFGPIGEPWGKRQSKTDVRGIPMFEP
jgi:hypothetical protein